MIDARIQSYLDSPIANASRASKVWLPEGRKSAPRAAKVKTVPAPGDLTPKQVREKADREQTAKMKSVLDYYGTTTVPFDRIAAHTNIPIERVAECMKERGRLS